ncbi:MAG: hypothetical protein INQ03_07700 [Candidatus Heimdallarchaeota archaeon]|nr:hypothetical protein [Candidatus Heimdallarchaeota archaeon]
MKEYRIIKEDDIKIYDDADARFLYTLEYRGLFKKRLYILQNDEPVIMVQSSLFKTKWKAEFIDEERVKLINKPFFGVFRVLADDLYLWRKSSKLELVGKNTKKLAANIDTTRLVNKNSLIITDFEVLDSQLGLISSLLVVLKDKLL